MSFLSIFFDVPRFHNLRNVVPPSHAVGVEPGVEVEAEGLQKAPSPSPMVGNGDCKTLWVGDIQVGVADTFAPSEPKSCARRSRKQHIFL